MRTRDVEPRGPVRTVVVVVVVGWSPCVCGTGDDGPSWTESESSNPSWLVGETHRRSESRAAAPISHDDFFLSFFFSLLLWGRKKEKRKKPNKSFHPYMDNDVSHALSAFKLHIHAQCPLSAHVNAHGPDIVRPRQSESLGRTGRQCAAAEPSPERSAVHNRTLVMYPQPWSRYDMY